ncbi:phytanoyl-CoA dioxygenase family protein [Paenibacillus sp. J5C_2022]|uniref:phytanoyl-CoA dioxygenase family protein n=1 Tax=Paenibacillus sp. J5C2022 TaxID=2977129 RepID=UPI0021D370B0|nr:phytanoyl-CoA dioxygenase family protein [Paenibacillus sp. J5C2022]MCU6707717.1 phytanoyl-CoA dioxygenase family protein [Paenibacillus sp. J5C2022]
MLAQNQVQAYERDGFLVIENMLSEEEVKLYRELTESNSISALREQLQEKDKEATVHMLGLTSMSPLFLDLARHPAIVSCLQPLLGPDIQLQHSKLATKPAAKGKGIFPWHQDYMFYPHTNTDILSVMIMLDDATEENGCMQMVKGSHKLGPLDHTKDGYFIGACSESRYWEDGSHVVNIMPRAGGISIHHGLTLHGSGPNLSGKPRRGIVFSYRADDAYQLADGVWSDTGVLISGQRGERVRCDAGVVRLPRTLRYPGYPFGHAWNQEGEMAKRERER